MIIAQVLSSFQIGGQEVMALELATRQLARGHRVIAVSLERGELGPLHVAFARAGIETAHVPKFGPRLDLTLPFRLALLFHRHAVEVAHLHNHLPLIYGTPAGRMNHCAVVATRHGQDEGSPRQIWLRRQIARGVDSYVAVSRQVANNARAYALSMEPKLTVIENGIDLDCYEPRPKTRLEVRKELGLQEGTQVIGTVCRLVECKNLGLLIRSCIPHLGRETQLVVVGDGPERSTLESLAAKHSRGRFVRFLGERRDVARLLNAFDLFAMASKTEGHPIAVIEAMATGLPVLATKVGGIPEMVEDGTTGFLAEIDEPAFASRLTEALDRAQSWAAMGRAARAAAHQHFSSKTMADRYEALYESIKQRQRVS